MGFGLECNYEASPRQGSSDKKGKARFAVLEKADVAGRISYKVRTKRFLERIQGGFSKSAQEAITWQVRYARYA
jgi:hypothetical protein